MIYEWLPDTFLFWYELHKQVFVGWSVWNSLWLKRGFSQIVWSFLWSSPQIHPLIVGKIPIWVTSQSLLGKSSWWLHEFDLHCFWFNTSKPPMVWNIHMPKKARIFRAIAFIPTFIPQGVPNGDEAVVSLRLFNGFRLLSEKCESPEELQSHVESSVWWWWYKWGMNSLDWLKEQIFNIIQLIHQTIPAKFYHRYKNYLGYPLKMIDIPLIDSRSECWFPRGVHSCVQYPK